MGKMGKYGEAAVKAFELLAAYVVEEPIEAWKKATIEIFELGTSGQLKGCPKDAFLGLCEEGLIKGIPPRKYSRSKKNKQYAVRAVEILKKHPELLSDKQALWRAVVGMQKAHNQQMDVVVELWKMNLIDVRDQVEVISRK
jgi:hypothetical protein